MWTWYGSSCFPLLVRFRKVVPWLAGLWVGGLPSVEWGWHMLNTYLSSLWFALKFTVGNYLYCLWYSVITWHNLCLLLTCLCNSVHRHYMQMRSRYLICVNNGWPNTCDSCLMQLQLLQSNLVKCTYSGNFSPVRKFDSHGS